MSKTWSSVGAAFVCLSTLAGAGCQASASELCHEIINRRARRYESCGVADYETARLALEEEFTAMPVVGVSCDDVDDISPSDRETVEERCFPWIDSASCEEVTTTLSEFCSDDLFVYHP